MTPEEHEVALEECIRRHPASREAANSRAFWKIIRDEYTEKRESGNDSA